MKCPNGCDLTGPPILPEHLHHYGGKTHYLRVISVEIMDLYDGGAYWRCPDCRVQWHRWSADTENGQIIRMYLQKHGIHVMENNHE